MLHAAQQRRDRFRIPVRVAGILAVVAAILALVGIKSVKQIKGKPERTIDNAQKTVEAIKPAK